VAKSIVSGFRSSVNPWIPIPTKDYFVDMYLRHSPAPGSTLYGRGDVLVDVPALTALAWLFQTCSRSRFADSVERGRELARFMHRSDTPHDAIYVCVQKMGRGIRAREYVQRVICVREDDGPNSALLLFSQPSKEVIDYGWADSSIVRGNARNFIRIEPLPHAPDLCLVRFFVALNRDEGCLPRWIWNLSIPRELGQLTSIRNEFQRDNEVDHESVESIKSVMSSPQTITPEEKVSIDAARGKLARFKNSDFTEISSPDRAATMLVKHVAGQANIYMRGVVTIDASLEHTAAKVFFLDSRAHYHVFFSVGGLSRRMTAINRHNYLYYVCYDLGSQLNLSKREWLTDFIWHRESNTSIIISGSPALHAAYPLNSKFVRAESSVWWSLRKLDPMPDGTPQTSASWTQVQDLKGFIPAFVVNSRVVETLSFLTDMRRFFDRSMEIDGYDRDAYVTMLSSSPLTPYTDTENLLIDSSLKPFSLFADPALRKKNVATTRNPTCADQVLHSPSGSWGRSETVVRSTKNELLAYLRNHVAKCRYESNDAERSIVEIINEHHAVVVTVKKLSREKSKNMRLREFVSRVVWKEQADGSVVISITPTEHPDRPNLFNVAGRAFVESCVAITVVNPDTCRLTLVTKVDLGKKLPKMVMNYVLIRSMKLAHQASEYLLGMRDLDEYDAEDGKSLGFRFMYPESKKFKKNRHDHVSDVIGRNGGLTELKSEFPWLGVFFEEAVKAILNLNHPIRTKLECLREADARNIGRNLGQALR